MFEDHEFSDLDAGSPPGDGMVVSISATIEINKQQITVNTQDVRNLKSGNIVFSISQPVVIGTPAEFVNWIAKELHLPQIDLYHIEAKLPAKLQGPFNDFMNGQIILTVLSVNQVTKTYKLGVVFKLQCPFYVLDGFLGFDSIGLMVTKSPDTNSPQSDVVTGDAGFFNV